MAADSSEELSRLPKRLRTAEAIPRLAPDHRPPAGAAGAARIPMLGGSNLGAISRPSSTSDAHGFPVLSSARIPRVGPTASSYNSGLYALGARPNTSRLENANAAHGLGTSTATPHIAHTVPSTAGPHVSAVPGLTSAPGPFGQTPLTASRIPRLAAAATTPYSANTTAQSTPLEPPATVPQRTQYIGPYSHIEAGNRAGSSTDIPSQAAPRSDGASRPACSSDSSSSGSCCCTICEEEYTEDGDHAPACLKCGHIFGQSCIRRWLSSFRKSCPLCQMTSKTTDIRRLYNLPRLVVQTPAQPAAAPAAVPPAAAAATTPHPSTTLAPVAGTAPPGATPSSGVAAAQPSMNPFERHAVAAASVVRPPASGTAAAAAGVAQAPPALAAVMQPAPGQGGLTTALPAAAARPPAAASTAAAAVAAAPPSAASPWAALLQPAPGQGGLGNELVLQHMVLSLSRDLAMARAELVRRNLAAA